MPYKFDRDKFGDGRGGCAFYFVDIFHFVEVKYENKKETKKSSFTYLFLFLLIWFSFNLIIIITFSFLLLPIF